MGSYGRVDEDLDEYEDDFIDDQDGDGVGPSRYGAGPSRYGAGPSRYADEEEDEEEEEVEEEPVSEEALKLLKYRQKLKEEIRSKMRQEDGGSSRDKARDPPSSNNLGSVRSFGSFFGSSQPVIADRVLQQSKALLETRHLARKASSSQNNGKKACMPSSSGTKNGVSCPPPASQVKSKAQIIKQTRDYSFLLSDDADARKPAVDLRLQKNSRDPGQQKNSGDPRQQKNFALKLDARPAQVPTKSNGPPAQSGRKGINGFEQRKPFGSPQVCSTRTAPLRKSTPDNRAIVSSDSRKQLDLRKQQQLTKQMVSGTGNGYARPPLGRALPQKRPSSSGDRLMLSGSAEKKLPVSSAGNKVPPVQRHSAPNGQRVSAEKSRASGVTKPLEHRRSVQQGSNNRGFRRENVMASKIEMKPPMQSSLRGNLDRNHSRVQKPHGQPSANNQSSAVRKVSNIKKRKAEDDDDLDPLSEIRKMFGYNPSRYRDDDNDDDCMEVGFDTIRQEEMRSARIAKKEDDEELEKIMEEERQERLRKKAKMRKMSQR